MRIANRTGWSLAAAALFVASSCQLTKTQVEEVVARSNAAMIQPSVDRPGGEGVDDLRGAVAQLDALIQANADQPVLANHLRVRQAMLLTVAGQDDLAEASWSNVQRSELKNPRDRGLFDANAHLVWAYLVLPSQGRLAPDDKVKDDGTGWGQHLTGLETAYESTKLPDLKTYFATVLAQARLKEANGAKTPDKAPLLKSGLEAYVMSFSEADRSWLKTGGHFDGIGASMAEFRGRVWLGALVQEYRNEAVQQELSVVWTPAWIGTLELPAP